MTLAISTRPSKRPSTKASARRAASAASKAKCTLILSSDSSQRLTVHAAMLGLDRSELVDQLIQTHLRRFVVSDRQREEAREGPADLAAHATQTGSEN